MTGEPITAWSFSRWDKHNTCPLKFKLEVVDKLPTHRGAAMERGDRIHKAIAAHLQAPETKPVPDDIKANAHIISELDTFDNKLVEQQWGFDRSWQPAGWFSKVKGHETWLRSILDVAVLYDDMSCCVIDWKSGKPRGTHDDQMELFAVSVFCHTPVVVSVETRLVYLDEDHQETANFDARDKDKLIAKWERKVAPMFEDTEYLPRPGEHCRFCDFSRSKGGQCRYG